MYPDAYSYNISLINNVFNGHQVNENDQLYNNATANNLSINEINYLESLNDIVSTNDTALNFIISQINSLEDQAEANLSDYEKKSVLTATSIAKHTLAYWAENLNNWYTLLNYENQEIEINRQNTNSKEINYTPRWYAGYLLWQKVKYYGKKDISSGVEAAVALRVAAIADPISWTGYALGIGGGAAGTSVGAIFE